MDGVAWLGNWQGKLGNWHGRRCLEAGQDMGIDVQKAFFGPLRALAESLHGGMMLFSLTITHILHPWNTSAAIVLRVWKPQTEYDYCMI